MEQTNLNDGIVSIYNVVNAAEAGETPLEMLEAEPKERLRYHRRTIGIKRHYEALQAKERVDLLIRVPFRPGVSGLDVAVPSEDGMQYSITLIQRIEDTYPPMMDLTLRRIEHEYKRKDQ